MPWIAARRKRRLYTGCVQTKVFCQVVLAIFAATLILCQVHARDALSGTHLADDALYMWTVYDHPTDMPDKFVARLFAIARLSPTPSPTETVIVADALDDLRGAMRKRGLTCLARDPSDDPKIVEVWL